MFYDNNGLIVQQDGDGGDTAGREGDYWFAQALYANGGAGLTQNQRDEFNRTITLLQVRPGVFVRNPTRNPVVPPAKAWNDPSDFSRDQQNAIIIALGQMGRYDVLKSLLWNQCKHFGFYPNWDLVSPEDIGYYIRAFHAWYLYPVLMLTDLGLVVESLIRCVEGANPSNTSDDINHTLGLLQAQYRLPTIGSWIARKIYTLFRPGGVQAAWDRYFDPNSGANDFNEIYKNLISSM